MIYEIRDYHYSPEKFEAYRAWADEAVAVLKDQLDVVGFWVDSGTEAEVQGSQPEKPSIGWANVTWILRWDSLEQREKQFGAAVGSEAWQTVWAKHPDPNGYHQMLSRFMTQM